ncbi:MAG: alpha-L-fucosidase, partial [Rhodopirellula sp. JB053]
GPTGEGVIPEPSVQRLAVIGDWMDVNGEAIYGCGPTPFGEELGKKVKDASGKTRVVGKSPWRATTKPGKIYIHLFEWPAGELSLPAIPGNVEDAKILGTDTDASLEVNSIGDRMTIRLPAERPEWAIPVICLTLAE